MDDQAMTIALPIDDRRRAHDFYVEALGLEAFGEIASDGLPEPLQFRLAPGVSMMLIPRGGFGWVIGDREVAAPPQTEVMLGVARASEAEVDALVAGATAAGATVVVEPQRQPWAYAGTFADPDGHLWTVTTD